MRYDFGGVVQEERDVSLEGQVVPKKDTFRVSGIDATERWRY